MIKDWQRYKQLENEKNAEAQEERRQLIERLAKNVDQAGALTGDKAPGQEAGKSEAGRALDQDLANDLLQDEFFKDYIRKKFEEMQSRNSNL